MAVIIHFLNITQKKNDLIYSEEGKRTKNRFHKSLVVANAYGINIFTKFSFKILGWDKKEDIVNVYFK